METKKYNESAMGSHLTQDDFKEEEQVKEIEIERERTPEGRYIWFQSERKRILIEN